MNWFKQHDVHKFRVFRIPTAELAKFWELYDNWQSSSKHQYARRHTLWAWLRSIAATYRGDIDINCGTWHVYMRSSLNVEIHEGTPAQWRYPTNWCGDVIGEWFTLDL